MIIPDRFERNIDLYYRQEEHKISQRHVGLGYPIILPILALRGGGGKFKSFPATNTWGALSEYNIKQNNEKFVDKCDRLGHVGSRNI